MEKTDRGVDKVARYGWRITSERGDMRWISKHLLHINVEDYQRDAAKQKVLDMAANWSWISCGAIVVAQREGQFWVVDGSHRKQAADRRSDVQELPCIVFQVDTVADEARAFLATNTARKPMTALGKFKAMVAAGDPAARQVQDVVSRAGLKLATASAEAGDFKAVGVALSLAVSNPETFEEVMMLCGQLARGDRVPVHQRLVKGLAYLHNHVDGGLNNARLRKRILEVGAKALLQGADKAAAYHGHAGNRVLAEGMLNAVNTRLHSKFTLISDSETVR